jgi:hypothetical protein
MLTECELLDPETREAVILHALAWSRFQFTWSWLAMEFKVHESKWPRKGAPYDRRS